MAGFKKYKSMQLLGKNALEVYLTSKKDGIDQLSSIRMLRSVFGLTLEDAKILCFEGDTGIEYNQQEKKQFEEFIQILDDELGSDM